MDRFTGRKIVLGVTGGIAAYKAAELVRLLVKQGADVRVVMTESAKAFISPLTFQALSGNPVHTDLLDPQQEVTMSHIELARWADIIIIAPTTANFVAKLRVGMADDLLSTLCLAATIDIHIVPAMNQAMWNNPATQENIGTLAKRNYKIVGPAKGSQACGETGFGRMLEPEDICNMLGTLESNGVLTGCSVLISAGPTREAIDPVRYISNRSSGKMGYALAVAARRAGAKVTLISGPVSLSDPGVEKLIVVQSAKEMCDAVMEQAIMHDIYIGAAAVADYTPVTNLPNKIKKQDKEAILTLRRTTDIIATLAGREEKPFIVGFAAETDHLEEYAKNKLKSKSLDMIAANWVGQMQGGFECDENALVVYWHSGKKQLNMAPKRELAEQLIILIAERFYEKSSVKSA